MSDLILSSAMDSFLAESDPANVLLPLTGGTMSAGADIAFANGSMLREGTTDAGNGGAGGIAQVCSISYELKWEAGRLYVMEQDGFTIRVEQHGFTDVPDAGDDDTKGYIVGSRRILDDGTTYVCTDATTGSAIWIPLYDYATGLIRTQDASYVVDLNNKQLLDGTNTTVDWGNRLLADGSTITSVDWDNRTLIANDGTTEMLNWSAYGVNIPSPQYLSVDMIYDGDVPQRYIDVLNGVMGDYNANTIPSIDWGLRHLITSDGTTAVVDWSDGGLSDASNYLSANWFSRYLYTASGNICVDWSNYMLVDSSGSQASLDWEARGIYDSSGAQSLGWSNRQLIASDGSTIAADWSTGTPAFAQGASYTPTAYASLPATPVEGTVCYVNDASTPVSLGAVVTDGGSEKVLACFNGTDWKVIAHL